jgi:hypothetical protein
VPLAPLPARLGGACSVRTMFDQITAAGHRLRGGRPARGCSWILGRDPWRPDPADPFHGSRWEQDELARARMLATDGKPPLLN